MWMIKDGIGKGGFIWSNISPEIKENRGQTNPSGAVAGENKW